MTYQIVSERRLKRSVKITNPEEVYKLSLSDILCKCTVSFIYFFLLKKCRFVIPYWARNYKNQEIRNSRKREVIDSFAPEIRQARKPESDTSRCSLYPLVVSILP